MSISLWASPKQYNSLLWKLVLRPNSCSKAHRGSFMIYAFSISCFMNRIVSSAYCSLNNPPSTRWDTIPPICPSLLALLIGMTNMSATMLKSRGESGSPCRRPFLSEKVLDLSIHIDSNASPEIKVSTHLIHLSENPFIRRVWNRNNHFTLS
jgi:hypothetical protein